MIRHLARTGLFVLAMILLFAGFAYASPWPWKPSPAGIAPTKHFEGFSPFPYRNTAGHITWGWGRKQKPGEPVPLGLLGGAGERLLLTDARDHAAHVERMVRVSLTPGQYDALADRVFKFGPGQFAVSTLLKRVKAEHHLDVAQ